jgi:hypothetical protein
MTTGSYVASPLGICPRRTRTSPTAAIRQSVPLRRHLHWTEGKQACHSIWNPRCELPASLFHAAALTESRDGRLLAFPCQLSGRWAMRSSEMTSPTTFCC